MDRTIDRGDFMNSSLKDETFARIKIGPTSSVLDYIKNDIEGP